LTADHTETAEQAKNRDQEQCDCFFQCNLLLLQIMSVERLVVKKVLIILGYKFI